MSKIVGLGTAAASHVLSGETFTSGGGANQEGSMPDNGALNITPSGTAAVNIPAGYTSGGSVAQVNVPAADVLTGTTIAGVTGTMPNQGSPTFTPTTSAQNIPAGYYGGGSVAAIPALKVLQISNPTTTSSSSSTFYDVNGAAVTGYAYGFNPNSYGLPTNAVIKLVVIFDGGGESIHVPQGGIKGYSNGYWWASSTNQAMNNTGAYSCTPTNIVYRSQYAPSTVTIYYE